MDLIQRDQSRLGSEELWSAIRDLAHVWEEAPVVTSFTASLPRNLDDSQTDLSQLIQSIFVARGIPSDRTLLLYSDLPYLGHLPFGPDPDLLHTEYEWWLNSAERVNTALLITIGWIRSRLPGYPLIPAPQLAKNSSLTTLEFTNNVRWLKDEMNVGLQFGDVPAAVAVNLQVGPEITSRLNNQTRILARALQGLPAWRSLQRVSSELGRTEKDELKRCRARIEEALEPSRIDHYDADNALARNQYRQHVVQTEVSNLTGQAGQYAEAFGQLNALLELAVTSVFSQLVCYPLIEVTPSRLDTSPGSGTMLRLSQPASAAPINLNPGSLVWINHPLSEDAVLITRVQHHWNVDRDTVIEVDSLVLEGSAEAWR